MRKVRALALAAVLGGAGVAAEARASAPTKHAKATAAATKGKGKASAKTRAAAKAKAAEPKDDAPVPVPGSKLAVFAFTGDDAESFRRQVVRVLRSKGLKTDTSLKPMFDSAEQYRETAAALGLVGYVDGEIAVDGVEASATIHLRSGATGLRIWSATFAGDRRQLAGDVGKQLWEQWSAALGKACADAAKPRKDREPMRINAGTPIADNPGQAE
jgi:hypothetical protein